MIEPKELQRLGEEIASDFLSRDIPMTQSLEKVATEYGLNKNQVQRVAEVANVKTYLSMLKEASATDAYIEFDVADPLVIKSIEKIAIPTFSFDYDAPPSRSSVIDTDIPLFKVASIESPSQTYVSPNEIYNKAVEIREKVARLQNRILEGSIRLEN